MRATPGRIPRPRLAEPAPPARSRSAVAAEAPARRVGARKRGPSEDLTAETRVRPVVDTLMAGYTVASPQAGPLLNVPPARNNAGAAPWHNPIILRLFRGTGRFGPRAAARNRGPSGDVTAEAHTSTHTFGTMHPAPGSHPSTRRLEPAPRPERALCVGSSLCRPATRRPRRLALDPNRLGRACGTWSELP
jgi:hypothetical protein